MIPYSLRFTLLLSLAMLSSPGRCLHSADLDSPSVSRSISEFTLSDFQGAKRSLAEWEEKPVVVVVFLGTECPLAKLYGQRLAALDDEFRQQGVQIIGINSNQQDTMQEMAAYAKKHGVEFPLLKDPGAQVADMFGATRTPEAFVLDRQRNVRYHGRIDDQYGVGSARDKPTRSELKEAVKALLSGKSIDVAYTEPVGCLIGRRQPSQTTGEVTYANQISRLLQQHCVSCHREGQIAPFALTDYDDVVAWSDMMLEVIEQERMPPWHANPAHGQFANDARMSDEEKALFRQWIEEGTPRGNPDKMPAPLEYPAGWQISEPDLVVRMPHAFEVPATGTVPYKYFTVDPGFEEDKWVHAAEARPGNRQVVHHLLLFYVPPERDSHRAADPLTNCVAAFAPGMPAVDRPEKYAMRIPAGSKLIFQMHYTPNGSPQTDLSEAGLVFSDPDKVEKEVRNVVAYNPKFLIPPGDPDYVVQAQKKIKQDKLLYTLTPHMHYRGKSFRFTARYPDGDSEILLDVPRYDFNWQLIYKLDQPKLLPAGTVIDLEAHFDNSSDNPFNPDPTQQVHWGDQTWDEMMIGTMLMSDAE